MNKKENHDRLISILLVAGPAFMLSPFFLYWWIHGDDERYLWIINGPFPFSSFGGGPFQLGMYLGLVFLGLMMFVVGLYLRKIDR